MYQYLIDEGITNILDLNLDSKVKILDLEENKISHIEGLEDFDSNYSNGIGN